MSQDIVNAAVMLLRSKALESYGVIKDCLRRPSEEQQRPAVVTPEQSPALRRSLEHNSKKNNSDE
jgi:hypothetical protein